MHRQYTEQLYDVQHQIRHGEAQDLARDFGRARQQLTADREGRDSRPGDSAGPMRREPIRPIDFGDQSANLLRPRTFGEMVGQRRVRGLMARLVANCKASRRPLDHMLLVGGSGTGKTTLGMVTAHELGRRVFLIKAPVAQDVFEELASTCTDGDVILVDEVHLQVAGDRRGATQAADPETYYGVMEDRRLMTAVGPVPFAAVTFIGMTTDAGLLPEPFIGRFPLQPKLDTYTATEMAVLAELNARALELAITDAACLIFARACRANPRQLNSYLRNAASLTTGTVDEEVAREVVVDLNSTTLDGLTRPMQDMLRFLLRSPRMSKGEVVYSASVNTIATALGFSRDTKHVALYVEPEMLRLGLVAVTPQGRRLTDAGIARARQLTVQAD